MANEIGFDTAAWMIDGARIPGDLSRVLAYAGTLGAEGIVTPGDCRVHELAIPGPQIEIDPGALIVLNRSAGVRNQSYIANARTVTRLDVTPTGSSGGRSDLVCLRLRDPQYKDWGTGSVPAEDLPFWQYAEPFIIEGVPPTTTAFQQLALDYSAYALSRLDIPAETATITDAMVKNLRDVAIPRRLRFVDRLDKSATTETFAPPVAATKWPTGIPDVSLDVPDWASKAFLSAQLDGIFVNAVPMNGWFRMALVGGTPSTTVQSKPTYYNETTARAERESYRMGGTVDIPATMRGQTVVLRSIVQRRTNAGQFIADGDSQLQYDVEFLGAAF